jgi:hypothetical protein
MNIQSPANRWAIISKFNDNVFLNENSTGTGTQLKKCFAKEVIFNSYFTPS